MDAGDYESEQNAWSKCNKYLLSCCYSAEHTVHDALTPEVSENGAVPPGKLLRIVFVFPYLEVWLLFYHHSLQDYLFLKVKNGTLTTKYFSRKNDTRDSRSHPASSIQNFFPSTVATQVSVVNVREHVCNRKLGLHIFRMLCSPISRQDPLHQGKSRGRC
ncbi:hypothetical protein Paes_0446 [Prosthecochloris aestuarii DSM 271]|uniref:Uncharacterized protein n=1 Tax=Prosthecochloris aestuarii (strain DSM 271 / SK 413) TaxID=290512 RepID=B4S505_PROA2|nr:hypothetical protein Paes_0446 [Prosthecochloris aestuarii DSM 271]